jgi:hypothetical protein
VNLDGTQQVIHAIVEEAQGHICSNDVALSPSCVSINHPLADFSSLL